MKLKQITHLLIQSVIRREKDKAYQMWIAQYFPVYDQSRFMEFKDFYKQLTEPVDVSPADESIKERYEKMKPGGL